MRVKKSNMNQYEEAAFCHGGTAGRMGYRGVQNLPKHKTNWHYIGQRNREDVCPKRCEIGTIERLHTKLQPPGRPKWSARKMHNVFIEPVRDDAVDRRVRKSIGSEKLVAVTFGIRCNHYKLVERCYHRACGGENKALPEVPKSCIRWWRWCLLCCSVRVRRGWLRVRRAINAYGARGLRQGQLER
jgi:hypothetical protein